MIGELWHGGSQQVGDDTDSYGANERDASSAEHLYRSVARRMISQFTGSHPAVMVDRVSADAFRLDLSSDLWRIELSRQERSLLLRHKLQSLYRGALRRYFLRSDCIFVNP